LKNALAYFCDPFDDGFVSGFASYAMVVGGLQILLISALEALEVKRICAVSSRTRRHQMD